MAFPIFRKWPNMSEFKIMQAGKDCSAFAVPKPGGMVDVHIIRRGGNLSILGVRVNKENRARHELLQL